MATVSPANSSAIELAAECGTTVVPTDKGDKRLQGRTLMAPAGVIE